MTRSRRWHNWAGNQVACPSDFRKPCSEDEVASLVVGAATQGATVKTVGAGHSFTSIAATDGLLLDVSAMSGIIDVDGASNQVRVRAGTRLADLNVMLDAIGLALPNLGDIAYQTVAGAISTSTHGTGRELSGLAGQVVNFRVVRADGEVVDTANVAHRNVLDVGRVSLGALGVLTEVTLQAVPAFRLLAREGAMRLDDVLESLDSLVDGNDHFEFFWIPHTGWALTKQNNRTDEPLRPEPRIRHWYERVFLENYAFGAVCAVGKRMPSQIPRLARALPASGQRSYVDKSFKVFASPRLVKFYEMEYSVPRAHATDAIREVRRMVDDRGYLLNFPVECRFTAADDIPLSTAHGRESAYIAVHVYKGMEFEAYFRDVESIMVAHGGRPHWGKIHFRTHHELRSSYPRFDEFKALRNEMDPQRLFSNDYTRQVLGD